MNNFLKAIALVLGMAAPAMAGSYYDLRITTTTGRAVENTAGVVQVSKSSGPLQPSSPTIVLDGVTGGVNASSGNFTYSISAASANIANLAIYAGASVLRSLSGDLLLDGASGTGGVSLRRGGGSSVDLKLDGSTGFIGMGNTSPAYRLHVGSGSIYSQYGIIATTGTIEGGGILFNGSQSFVASPSGYGKLYGLSGKGLTLQGEAGASVQASMLDANGARYYWEATNGTDFRIGPDGDKLRVGSRDAAIETLSTTGSMSATSYSSSPVVNTSTVSAPGAFALYTGGGSLAFRCTSTQNCGVNATASSISYPFEVGTASEGGMIGMIREDTSVAAGDDFGGLTFEDTDSSTGGGTAKARMLVEARGGWSSGNPMEMEMSFEFARHGGTLYNGVVFNSSGVVISPAGSGADAPALPSTSTLHVNGNASISDTVQAGTYKFNDGTSMTTAASGTDVGNSTVTYVQAGLTGHAATANPNECITGSTATVTCNTNCRLMAHYQTSHQAGAGVQYVNLLFDGAFAPYIATGSNSAPCATWDNGSNTAGLTCSILGPVMSAGSHNVCVAIGLSSGGANPNRAGQLSVVPVK